MNIKKLIMLMFMGLCSSLSFGEYYTTTVDGIDWNYECRDYWIENEYLGEVAILCSCWDEEQQQYYPGASCPNGWYDGGVLTIPRTLDGKYLRVIENSPFDYIYGMTEIVIPDTVWVLGYSALSLSYGPNIEKIDLPPSLKVVGDCAFHNLDIKSCVIPASVIEFGQQVFYGCDNLNNVSFLCNLNTLPYGTFEDCNSLTEIVFPESLERIEERCFDSCSSLKTIQLPDTVTYIGNSAFEDCVSLSDIRLPLDLQVLGDSVFKNCQELENVILPDKLETIGRATFENCLKLGSVTIPASVTNIGVMAFQGCNSLTNIVIDAKNKCYRMDKNCLVTMDGELVLILGSNKTEVVLPDSVVTVGKGAFAGMTNLTTVILPARITKLPDELFLDCKKLERVNIPDTVADIGHSVFKGCSALCEIVIPDSVTNIGHSAFMNCSTLEAFQIPKSMDRIHHNLFSGCKKLKTVEIPENIRYISYEAFSDCELIESVVLHDGVSFEIDVNWYNGPGRSVFSGCKSLNTIRLPTIIKGIGSSMFRGCSSLQTIEIPESVTSIGDSAFSGCSSLISFEIPKNITEISSGMFRDCISLENIVITSNIKKIGPWAFERCTALTEVYIPDGVVLGELNRYADTWNTSGGIFNGCVNLTTIRLPNDLVYLPESTFKDCLKLSQIDIPSTVTTLGHMAFWGCSSLSSVIFPTGLNEFEKNGWWYNSNVYGEGNASFGCCTNLVSVQLSSSMKEIPSSMFALCQNLISITIPDTVTTIEKQAFYHCSKLSTIKFSKCLTTIGSSAFECCDGLQSLELPLGLNSIDACGFAGCIGLQVLHLPRSLKSTTLNFEISEYYGRYYYNSWDEAFSRCLNLKDITINKDILTKGVANIFPDSKEIEKITVHDDMEYVPDEAFMGLESLQTVIFLGSVSQINTAAFKNCINLKSVTLPQGLRGIGDNAFENCSSLSSIYLPASLSWLSSNTFSGCYFKDIVIDSANTSFKLVDGQIVNIASGGVCYTPSIGVKVIATSVREDDPTILDVTYIMQGNYDKVDVRALAFEDGTRSWAKVVRPETFVTTPTGAASIIGDNVGVNVTNVFSWKVSSDYTNNLAKLKVEIFVQTDDLLPMEFMTIPAYNGKPSLEFSRNTLTDANVMNALYWLYADNDSGLTLSGGVLKNGSSTLAQGNSFYPSYNNDYRQKAADYVLRKMGYQRLTTANYLDYVNTETRLNLSPSGIRQYAVKEVE